MQPDSSNETRNAELAAGFLAQVRYLPAILDALTDEVWICDSSGRVVFVNEAATRTLGRIPEWREPKAVSECLADLSIFRSDGSARPINEAPIIRALAGETIVGEEENLKRADGQESWTRSIVAIPIRNDNGRVTGAVAVVRDITARKQDEQQHELVAREAIHRVKNILTIIDVIARRTASEASSLNEFMPQFTDRLHALAKSHDLLLVSQGHASLGQLLEAELAAWDSSGRTCLVDGPRVELDETATSLLGLAFHELTTNAAKYGALASPRGSVHVQWFVDASAIVHFTWKEEGGPAVQPLCRDGFGSRLLTKIVPHKLSGRAELLFAADGLVYRLTFPLSTKAFLTGKAGR
jgi:PAS domain S-box-containing protein